MGKNLVVLTGSPRRNGNSARLADSLIRAAEAKGFETTRFDLAFLKLNGCNACNACFRNGKPCAFSEDFNKIADAMQRADAVAIVSPLYWYSFPAQLKAAIDKFYSFSSAGKNFAGKKAALLACCEEETTAAFDGMKFEFEKSMRYLQFEIVDEIFVPGVGGIGAIEKTDGEARAAALAEKL